MENIKTKDVEMKEKDTTDYEPEGESKKADMEESAEAAQDELFTKIDVNTLTQSKDLAAVLHKILTLCHLSKTVDPKVLAWVKLVETTTRQEFEELTKVQKNFDFQIANRDFRNDEKLKREFAIGEQRKMTQKLTSLIDVPMIDETLIKSQINLNEAEFAQLAPFYFPATGIDIVAVVTE